MTPADDPRRWRRRRSRRRRMRMDVAAAVPRVPSAATAAVSALLWSVFLLLSADSVSGNSTIPEQNSNSTGTNGPDVAAIVAPTVTLGLLALALAALAWLLCVVKKKRQTEGTYRPSAEEQSGARSVAAPDALKLPKEERLI